MARQLDVPTLYLTSVAVDIQPSPLIYVPSPTTPGAFETIGAAAAGLGLITMEIQMDATPGAHAIVEELAKMKHGFHYGVPRREYRCLWCGCANPVDSRFCSQCGGPRGWLL